MRKLVAVLALSLGLGACATYEPVPKEYTGPTASVTDTGFSEDGSKAQMSALMRPLCRILAGAARLGSRVAPWPAQTTSLTAEAIAEAAELGPAALRHG